MRRSPLSFLRRRNKNVVLSNNDYRTSRDVAETPETVVLASRPPLCTATVPTNTPFANSAHDDPVLTDGRFGVETIWNPPNADMDIWFVHGLTGDRETTWKHPNGIFTPSLIRTRFPSARIISYGYDANVVGLWKNASGDGLRGHGKALAYAISNTRRKETERPLFFIAHSLGGLVTEQALLISLEPSDPRLHTIAPCTAGIIFMGTPHSGADLAAWGCALAKVIDPIRRVNKELLSVLKQRSEVLKAVQETFQRQLTSNGASDHVRIFCFYETVAVNLVGFVVPEESATMRQHPNCGIDANHMDMTKFTSLQDAGFINLEGVLHDWVERGKVSKSSDVKSKVEEKASSMAMTFSNGPITTNVFQQGTGNAGRDINHGNVAYQMA